MNRRLVSIDIARGICIILVVIGHYLPENSPNWYLTLNRLIYLFHMPLFMFVSGYVYWITKKPIRYKEFVLKKFKRLMIPYFFVSILVISLKLLSERGMFLQNPVSFSAFYEMFYYPVAGFFLWFAMTLFLIFLIIPFFSTRRKILVLFIISLVLYFAPVNFPQILCFPQLKVNLIYFILGCLISEWSTIRRITGKIHFFILIVLFIVSYFGRIYLQLDNEFLLKCSSIYLSLLGILMIANFSRKIQNYSISWLFNISMASYTIYLLHTTFEGFMKALLLKLPLSSLVDEKYAFIFSAILVITAGVLIPLVIHQITERRSKILSFCLGLNYIGKNK